MIRKILVIGLLSSQMLWAQSGAKWNQTMKEMAGLLEQAYLSKSNDLAMATKLSSKLKGLSHTVGIMKIKELGKSDPSMLIFAKILDEQFRLARFHAEQRRDGPTSLRYLRGAARTCLACHGRTQATAKFISDFGNSLGDSFLKKDTTAFQKADFLQAVRRENESLEAYLTALKTPHESPYMDSASIEWERGLQNALVLTVKTMSNQEAALKVIDTALANSSMARFIPAELKAWREAIVIWKSEFSGTPKTVEGYLAEAKRLLVRAKEVQKFPIDRTGDIFYLRATSRLHEMLDKFPENENVAQALELLGMSYRVLDSFGEMGAVALPDAFFESCIETKPHSEIAEACFSHYESGQIFGYTGSSGTHLPESVSQRLEELRKLSNAKDWH